MSEWVDLQLSHQLSQVTAPEELWTRIQSQPARRPKAVPRLALAAAAIAVIAVAYSSTKPREAPRASFLPPSTCSSCHL
jgi:hypothetical protein